MKIKFILFALSLISLNANAQQYNYDVNQDGKVTVSDVMLVVNKILGNDTEKPRYPLTISVSEKPIVDANAPSSSKKKTPETTIDNLTEFYMNYTYKVKDYEPYWSRSEQYIHKAESTGKWIVGNSEEALEGYWPTPGIDGFLDENVTFYAYANVNITNSQTENQNAVFFCENDDISKPYIDFKIDENSGATKDFLVAQRTDNYNNCNGHIFFEFSHACAAAQFFLIKSDRLADATVEVTNVKLHNVLGEGEYYFNTGWASLDNPMTFTLWDSKSGKITVENSEKPFQLSVAKDKAHDYFFFIPQKFTGWSPTPSSDAINGTTGSYLEIVCKITDKNGDYFDDTAYLPFATSSALVAGKAYPVNINMNTNLRDENGYYILNADGTIANRN